jgi:hypothetical protein
LKALHPKLFRSYSISHPEGRIRMLQADQRNLSSCLESFRLRPMSSVLMNSAALSHLWGNE